MPVNLPGASLHTIGPLARYLYACCHATSDAQQTLRSYDTALITTFTNELMSYIQSHEGLLWLAEQLEKELHTADNRCWVRVVNAALAAGTPRSANMTVVIFADAPPQTPITHVPPHAHLFSFEGHTILAHRPAQPEPDHWACCRAEVLPEAAGAA